MLCDVNITSQAVFIHGSTTGIYSGMRVKLHVRLRGKPPTYAKPNCSPRTRGVGAEPRKNFAQDVEKLRQQFFGLDRHAGSPFPVGH
jgi:hypothetical protein